MLVAPGTGGELGLVVFVGAGVVVVAVDELVVSVGVALAGSDEVAEVAPVAVAGAGVSAPVPSVCMIHQLMVMSVVAVPLRLMVNSPAFREET